MTWGFVLCSCNGLDVLSRDNSAPSGGEEVVLGVGRSPQTRTVYDDDTKSFAWQNEDKVFVWAKSASGSYALENTAFSLLARPSDESSAYFTATLASPMEEGTYSYYVAYPAPSAVSGTTVTFTVPSVQDGTASGDIDILLSQPVQGGALQVLEEGTEPVSKDVMSVKMKHLLHYLRFYIPEGKNTLGEPVTSLEFSMPQNIAGNVSVDVTDASSASLSDGTTDMTLELSEPLTDDPSSVAVAGIFPPSAAYSAADKMNVTVYSDHKEATVYPISLSGRTFEAGHITSVPLKPADLIVYSVKFTLVSNNLGEDPQKITFTLPEGTTWPEGASNKILWEPADGGNFSIGDSYLLETTDRSAFRALSSKNVTVSYESENAIVSEILPFGDLSSARDVSLSLNCPYLFFEDFSTVESFNSGDLHKTSNAGSKDPKVFNGWSVARAGAQAGTAIRLAARRETNLAHYPARADSPFLSGLKEGKTVNLDIQFNYSMGRAESNEKAKASQTVYFGYITTSSNLKSGDSTGTYSETDFSPLNETSGSYSNINHLCQTTLADVQAPLRLSWRTVTNSVSGGSIWETPIISASNSTCWLYIDNIRVKIKK